MTGLQTKPIKIHKQKATVYEPVFFKKRSNSMIFVNNGCDSQFIVNRKRSNSVDFTPPSMSPISLNQSQHHQQMYAVQASMPHKSDQYLPSLKPRITTSLSDKTLLHKKQVRRFGVPVPEIRSNVKQGKLNDAVLDSVYD